MISGTPFASTRLPGIPQEYFDYIIPIEDYSAKGIADAVNTIRLFSTDQLKVKARKAREYVIKEKNNLRQGEKIVDFLEEVCRSKE